MTVRYERVEPCTECTKGKHILGSGGIVTCPGGSRTILEPTEIRWCETHESSVDVDIENFCLAAAFLDWIHTERNGPKPDICSIVSALLVLPG